MTKYNNAMNVNFEEIEFEGKPALFTLGRVERATVPNGYFLYELRHDDDCKGDVVQVGLSIFVNHWGSIITKDEIILQQDNLLNVEPNVMTYGTGDCRTMDEFMAKYPHEKDSPMKHKMSIQFTIHTLKNILQLADSRENANLGNNIITIHDNGKITQGSKLESVEKLTFPFSGTVINQK